MKNKLGLIGTFVFFFLVFSSYSQIDGKDCYEKLQRINTSFPQYVADTLIPHRICVADSIDSYSGLCWWISNTTWHTDSGSIETSAYTIGYFINGTEIYHEFFANRELRTRLKHVDLLTGEFYEWDLKGNIVYYRYYDQIERTWFLFEDNTKRPLTEDELEEMMILLNSDK